MESYYNELRINLLEADLNNDASKLTNLQKLRRSLKKLALSGTPESLPLLEKIVSKYVAKPSNGSKSGMFVFHALNKGEIYNALILDSVLEQLYNANTPPNNEFLRHLGTKHTELINLKLKTAVRMFPPDQVFEHYSKDLLIYPDLAQELMKAYSINDHATLSDSERKWDKRWAGFLLDHNEGAWAISVAYPFIFDSDAETWSKLLSLCEIPKREAYNNERQYRQDCTFYGELLHVAYKNNHPKKNYYYAAFIKKGFPRELLDKLL